MYLKRVEQTKEETIAMYMNCSKEELASILYEANRILSVRPMKITYGENFENAKPIEKYIPNPTNPTC